VQSEPEKRKTEGKMNKMTAGSDLRRVNLPQTAAVEEDSGGLPVAVVLSPDRRETVECVLDRWRLDDEWWRSAAVCRLYYAVMLSSGRRLVIYKDFITGAWYRGNT
jgi:hypothetical protein